MLSSPNLPTSSVNRRVPSFFSTSFTSRSPFAQTLPTFSTPSKHRLHSNACNSSLLMFLLHTSLYTRGVRLLSQPKYLFPSLSRFLPSSSTTSPATPFFATLTASPQHAENSATLSPFPATLTRPVTLNSFVCHSYKKHPGWGAPSSSMKRILLFWRHTTCKQYLVSAPSRIRKCETQNGGDCA